MAKGKTDLRADPGDACHWRAPLLGGPVDTSHVGWIMTANALDGVPAPLRHELAREEGLDPRWYPSLDPAELEAVMSSDQEHPPRRRVRHLLALRPVMRQ